MSTTTKPSTSRPDSTPDNRYNGWANYETWNVALWISNDEGLYNIARMYRHRGYKAFVEFLRGASGIGGWGALAHETPDGVPWNDSGLDIDALDKMLEEL